jgi:hypothetical protein
MKHRVQLVKAAFHWIRRMIHRGSLEQQERVRLHLNLSPGEMNLNCGWKKALNKRKTATKYMYFNFRLL